MTKENQNPDSLRSDLFLIEEGVGKDVQLKTGTYLYEIYDADDTLCERGRILVIKESDIDKYPFVWPNGNPNNS